MITYILEAASFPVLLWVWVGVLKRPTFPPSSALSPRPDIPECKETSEVNP